MPRALLVCLVLLVCLAPLPRPMAAAAETRQDAVFDVEISGFRAGVFRLSRVETAGSYAATARFETAGLVGLFRPLRFQAEVQGGLAGGQKRPARYSEDVQTPRREGRTEIAWERGVPRVIREEPEHPQRPWHLDPASQGGTLDPMSALLQLLGDVPAARACRLEVVLFDGRRRAQVLLNGTATAAGDEVACDGAFRRLAGYSESEMAENDDFPFTLTYAPNGDGTLQVVRIETATSYGPARLLRR